MTQDNILKENKRLKDALFSCKHRVEMLRIWGGTGWSWQNLHAKAIYEIIVKALDDKP